MATLRTTRSLVAVLAVCAAALAGCASSTSADHGASHGAMPMMSASAGASAGAESGTASSMTDVMFAQMMIPHHEQAVEMADLAFRNAGTSPEVLALATQITAAQQPEIDAMTAWLDEWGVPSMMDADDAGHMGHGMDGMMTDEEMRQLEQATGDAFDALWLELMIRHHEGAIDMAKDVLETSTDPRVIELAESILVTQAEEIATMQGLLASASPASS